MKTRRASANLKAEVNAMHLTPEIIEALGKAFSAVLDALGSIVMSVTGAVTAFYTWKTRSELDELFGKGSRRKGRKAMEDKNGVGKGKRKQV